MREEFTDKVKPTAAQRAGNVCSNPDCRAPTAAPQLDPTKSLSVGVAAHITAASQGGPRFKPALSTKERRGSQNAIWLCENCARKVDCDPDRFTEHVLRQWKQRAEEEALARVGKAHSSTEPTRGKSPQQMRSPRVGSIQVEPPRPHARSQRPRPTSTQLKHILDALDDLRPEMRAPTIKDLEALSYSFAVEQEDEVLDRLPSLLGGSVGTRVLTLQMLRTFLVKTDTDYRNELWRRIRQAIVYQFQQATDLSVKQWALNALDMMPDFDDFELILDHVASSPPAMYNQCRPFYYVRALADRGHETEVRAALYALKQETADPETHARVDELLEQLRSR